MYSRKKNNKLNSLEKAIATEIENTGIDFITTLKASVYGDSITRE